MRWRDGNFSSNANRTAETDLYSYSPNSTANKEMTTLDPANQEACRIRLDDWRKKIDAIDLKLSALLCERLHCAENISALKAEIGEQVLQPEREKEVLDNVLGRTSSELQTRTLEKIYRCIIEETRLFQHEWKSRDRADRV